MHMLEHFMHPPPWHAHEGFLDWHASRLYLAKQSRASPRFHRTQFATTVVAWFCIAYTSEQGLINRC